MKKIMLILIISLIITMFTINVLAEPVNETWADDHWGGDTGEETYSDPIPPPEEQKTTGICGAVIFSLIPIGLYIFQRKYP